MFNFSDLIYEICHQSHFQTFIDFQIILARLLHPTLTSKRLV